MVQIMQSKEKKLQAAEKSLAELKEHKETIRVEEQLSSPEIQKKIAEIQK